MYYKFSSIDLKSANLAKNNDYSPFFIRFFEKWSAKLNELRGND